MSSPWDSLKPREKVQSSPEVKTDSADPWAQIQPRQKKFEPPVGRSYTAQEAWEETKQFLKDTFLKPESEQAQKGFFPRESPEEIRAQIKKSAEEDTLGRYATQGIGALGELLTLPGEAAQFVMTEPFSKFMDPWQMEQASLDNPFGKMPGNGPSNLTEIFGYKDIEKWLEKELDIPLEAKTPGQKSLRFGLQVPAFAGKNINKLLSTIGSAGAKRVLMETPLQEQWTNLPVLIPKISSLTDFRKLIAGAPTQERLAIEQQRKALGLPNLPLSETAGKLSKQGEQFFRYWDIGQDYANSLIENFDKGFVDTIKGGLQKLSPIEFSNSLEAGRALKVGKDTLFPKEKPLVLFGKQQAGDIGKFKGRVQPGGKKLGIEVPVDRQFRNPTKAYEESLAPQAVRSDIEGGVNLMREVQNQNQVRSDYFRNSYDALRDAAQEVPAKPLPQLIERIDELNKDLAGSLVESAAEKTTLGAGRQIRQNLVKNVGIEEILNNPQYAELITPEVREILESMTDLSEVIGTLEMPRNIPLSRLIKTQKSLNSILDFEVEGGFKQNLKTYRKLINEAIESYAEEAPEVVANLRRLDSEFADFAEYFRSDEIAPLLRNSTKNYEDIYKKSLNTGDYNLLRHVLQGSPEGQEILGQMQRDLFYKKIGSKLEGINTAEGFEKALDRTMLREIENFRDTLSGNQVHEFNNYLEYITQKSPKIQDKITAKGLTDNQIAQQVISSLEKHDPSDLIKSLDNLSNVEKIKGMLIKTPQGKEIWDSIARYKMEQQFSDLFLSQKQGRFDYNQFEKMLHDKDTASWIKAVGGDDYFEKLNKMANLSFDLSKKFKTLPTSSELSLGAQSKPILRAVKFAKKFTVNPIGAVMDAAKGYSLERSLEVAAKKLADPKFIDMVNEFAENASKGKLTQANTLARNLIDELPKS